MVGQQIGDFRIIEKLGEGGMGVVYKALDVRLDRPVAIKMLTAGLTDNPELVLRFQAEAKAQANLNHTNLATLYAFLVDQGNAYMVMEFVEGENFDQIIRRNGPINPRDAVPWFKQALLGIGAAHRVGIIHRDIKPSNLMLNRQGIVKVMDFGIAKAIGTRGMTRTGVHLGTLAYMSPEQIQNRTVDVRSDIYALGVTLYEMFTGHVPFESDSDFQIMHDHVSAPPPALTRYYPYAPREFEGVVAKALAKNPDDRFQTVEEFGVALEHPESASLAPVPLPVAPPAMAGRTVVESVTGAGQWQATGAAPPAPAMVGSPTVVSPPAVAGSPAVVGSPTVVGPPPVATGGPTPPKKLSPRAGMMIIGGVLAAVAITVAVILWTGKTPAPAGGGASGGATAGQSIAESRPSGSSQEIVISPGGSPETPPANATPANPTPPARATPGRRATGQPRSQQQPAYQPPQSPSQPQEQPPAQTVQPPPQQQPVSPAGTQSFIVKHRHLVREGIRTQVYYCAGALLLKRDGTVSYNCAGTNDPSKRCEQVTFPPGSIKEVKLRWGIELHMSTTHGNWDFYDYNVPGSINKAYQAILPFAR